MTKREVILEPTVLRPTAVVQRSANTNNETMELLQEIREELRVIRVHVTDSGFKQMMKEMAQKLEQL